MAIIKLRSVESNHEQTIRAITDGGQHTIERLADIVDVDLWDDHDGYNYVDLWTGNTVTADHCPVVCLHVDDYYADDPRRAALAFRAAWARAFDEILGPISADEWLTLREHWEHADGDDSAPNGDGNDGAVST